LVMRPTTRNRIKKTRTMTPKSNWNIAPVVFKMAHPRGVAQM
jgi:hypothetical protein